MQAERKMINNKEKQVNCVLLLATPNNYLKNTLNTPGRAGGGDKKQCLKIFPIIQFFSEPLTQYPHYS